jgi:hypothetical protein
MTHSILTIPLRVGDEDASAHAFVRLEVPVRAAELPASRGGELLRPRQPGDDFVVRAGWDDPAGSHAWLDAAIRAGLGEEIGPLVAGPTTSRLSDEGAR